MRASLIVTVFAACVLSGVAVAQPIIAPDDTFPVDGAPYVSRNSTTFEGIIETEIVAMELTGTSSAFRPTTLSAGGSFPVESFFDVFVEMSVDGGASWMMSSPNTRVVINVVNPNDSAVGSFQAEIVEMVLIGDVADYSMELRESPTLQSVGDLSVAHVGGLYHIDSFFDVFTELSVDGGDWIVATEMVSLNLTPEPTTSILVLAGLVGILRRRR